MDGRSLNPCALVEHGDSASVTVLCGKNCCSHGGNKTGALVSTTYSLPYVSPFFDFSALISMKIHEKTGVRIKPSARIFPCYYCCGRGLVLVAAGYSTGTAVQCWKHDAPRTSTVECCSIRVAGNRCDFLSGVLPRVRLFDGFLWPWRAGPWTCHHIVWQFVVKPWPQSGIHK